MNGTAYISGPISSKPKTHIADFKKAKEWLLYYDFFPIDPHDVSPYKPGKKWAAYLGEDIRFLYTYCDHIYFLPGWWHSVGAWLELIVALSCKIKILNFSLPKDRKPSKAKKQPSERAILDAAAERARKWYVDTCGTEGVASLERAILEPITKEKS